MEYLEFERIFSAKRMQRYKDAANGETRKAMALYRYSLRLSQEMFTIVSCFEVALRNAIDGLLVTTFSWMGIDSRSMLYGLDHVQSVCTKINSLKE